MSNLNSLLAFIRRRRWGEYGLNLARLPATWVRRGTIPPKSQATSDRKRAGD